MKQCVVEGLVLDMDITVFAKCADDDAKCYCEIMGYGSRGPKLVPHASCQKYVSCFSAFDSLDAAVMECEPGYAYDVANQVCYFKGLY
jgi:Chitin binding Peritrophin-A domain